MSLLRKIWYYITAPFKIVFIVLCCFAWTWVFKNGNPW